MSSESGPRNDFVDILSHTAYYPVHRIQFLVPKHGETLTPEIPSSFLALP